MNVPRGRQDAQHEGFVDAFERYDCSQCIGARGERFGFPPLDAENHQAWSIFHEVEDQLIVGMDVVGLDYKVLPTVFDLYDIPHAERRLLFEKIVIVNRAQQRERSTASARKASLAAEQQSQRVASGG